MCMLGHVCLCETIKHDEAINDTKDSCVGT